MSTDVEKIRQGMLMIHEFWANTIEVGTASFLLYRSLGVAFLAPILIITAVVGVAAGLSTIVSTHSRGIMLGISIIGGILTSIYLLEMIC